VHLAARLAIAPALALSLTGCHAGTTTKAGTAAQAGGTAQAGFEIYDSASPADIAKEYGSLSSQVPSSDTQPVLGIKEEQQGVLVLARSLIGKL
jgi:hypothetical protein